MLTEISVNIKYATEIKEAEIRNRFFLQVITLKNQLLEQVFIPFTRLQKIDPAQLKSKAEIKHKTFLGTTLMKLKMFLTMPFLIIRGTSRVSPGHTARFMTWTINSNSRFWILKCKKRVVKMWLGHWSRDSRVPGPKTHLGTWAVATPTAPPNPSLGLPPFSLLFVLASDLIHICEY